MTPTPHAPLVARIAGAVALALLVTANCARREVPAGAVPVVERIESPAPPGAAQPFLSATRDGRVHLSWLVRQGERVDLAYATHDARAWSAPRTVTSGGDLLVNWADVPSLIALDGDACVAHWPVHRPGGEHACDIRVAVSPDGAAWPDARSPHRDELPVEHAFASLIATGGEAFTCVWLDGREYAGKEEGDPGAQSQLRAADWAGGTFGAETVLDPKVCDCCPTAAVRTASGMLVAYRDRSDDEVRDIWLVRRDRQGTWSAPYALSTEAWRIPGCPVNGPALAAADDEVAAVWFTMAADTAVVMAAWSHDGGATFSPAARIDDGSPVGRVDVALLADGDALAVWVETANDGRSEIRARRLHANGRFAASFPVGTTTADRASGFPRVVTTADAAWFAWTETGDPPHVRTARLSLTPDARSARRGS